MANNYLQFSFDFIVPESQRGWVKEVFELGEDANGDDLPEGSPLADIFPEWGEYQELGFCGEIQADDGVCWIYAEESGNTEQVACFLLALLDRCYKAGEDLNQVGFTYSETCSSMRVGEFSGGAVRVFLNGSTPETEWMHANHWLMEAMK